MSGFTGNLYDASDGKILAVMYGIAEESDGSWNAAVEVTEFFASRYLESGSHFLPSTSVPPLPEVKTNDSVSPLRTWREFKRKDRQIMKRKLWVLACMAKEKEIGRDLHAVRRTGKQGRLIKKGEKDEVFLYAQKTEWFVWFNLCCV